MNVKGLFGRKPPAQTSIKALLCLLITSTVLHLLTDEQGRIYCMGNIGKFRRQILGAANFQIINFKIRGKQDKNFFGSAIFSINSL